jgi:hypothetical protein
MTSSPPLLAALPARVNISHKYLFKNMLELGKHIVTLAVGHHEHSI